MRPGGKPVFATKWFSVQELDNVSGGDPYYVLQGPDAIILFVLNDDGQVVLVRQDRPARGHITLEVPAGAVDLGETCLEAAIRELREETGYAPGQIYRLGSGGLRLDRDEATMHGFMVFGAKKLPQWQAEPGVEVVHMPLSAFADLIRKGEFEQLGAAGLILQAVLCFPDQLRELLPAAAFGAGPDLGRLSDQT